MRLSSHESKTFCRTKEKAPEAQWSVNEVTIVNKNFKKKLCRRGGTFRKSFKKKRNFLIQARKFTNIFNHLNLSTSKMNIHLLSNKVHPIKDPPLNRRRWFLIWCRHKACQYHQNYENLRVLRKLCQTYRRFRVIKDTSLCRKLKIRNESFNSSWTKTYVLHVHLSWKKDKLIKRCKNLYEISKATWRVWWKVVKILNQEW